MKPANLFLGLLAAAALSGCYTLPERVRADFAQPDGKRPNNFGKVVPGTRQVQPDRPTIAAPGRSRR